jgi:hypothetical protein
MPEKWTLDNASNEPTFRYIYTSYEPTLSYAYRASPYIHLMNLHSAMPIHIHLLLYFRSGSVVLVFVLFVYVSVWKRFQCGFCDLLWFVFVSVSCHMYGVGVCVVYVKLSSYRDWRLNWI